MNDIETGIIENGVLGEGTEEIEGELLICDEPSPREDPAVTAEKLRICHRDRDIETMGAIIGFVEAHNWPIEPREEGEGWKGEPEAPKSVFPSHVLAAQDEAMISAYQAFTSLLERQVRVGEL